MAKRRWLPVINPLLGLLVIYQAATGLTGEELGRAFLPMHVGGALLLVVVASVHLALNWGWVRATYGRRIRQGEAP